MKKFFIAILVSFLLSMCGGSTEDNQTTQTKNMDSVTTTQQTLTDDYKNMIDSFVTELKNTATCKHFLVGGQMGGECDICVNEANQKDYFFKFSSFYKEKSPSMLLFMRNLELVFVCEVIPDYRGDDGLMKYMCIAYYLKEGKILGATKCKREGLWDQWYDCEDFKDFNREEKEKLFQQQLDNLKRGYEKFPELKKIIENR